MLLILLVMFDISDNNVKLGVLVVSLSSLTYEIASIPTSQMSSGPIDYSHNDVTHEKPGVKRSLIGSAKLTSQSNSV